MTDEQQKAVVALYEAWIQFINCWADPFNDPAAEAVEEEQNVRRLGLAFDRCVELGVIPPDWDQISAGSSQVSSPPQAAK